MEVKRRLGQMTPVELGGKANQLQDAENKLDQWVMYCMFACACPPDIREDGNVKMTREIFHLILPSLRQASDSHAVSTPSLSGI